MSKKTGYYIKYYRKQKDLTQEQLARKSGISEMQIFRLESGVVGSPTLETINSIAKALEIDPSILIEAQGTPLENQDDSPEVLIERLNRILNLDKKIYLIENIVTEQKTNEYVRLPRWEMKEPVIAIKIKKNWIIEDKEFKQGDVLIVEKGASLEDHNGRFATVICTQGKRTALKIHYSGDMDGYYGRVVKFYRNI